MALSLVEVEKASVSLVGGKAQTLAKLKRAGFMAGIHRSLRRRPRCGAKPRGPWPGTVWVRSSGVSEDGAEQSLAGRYKSILDVEASSLVDAVAQVREFAHVKDGERIAVLVQTMVHPVCAGVAFTADPMTGDRSTTIVTATTGTADRLVSGQIGPHGQSHLHLSTPLIRRGRGL